MKIKLLSGLAVAVLIVGLSETAGAIAINFDGLSTTSAYTSIHDQGFRISSIGNLSCYPIETDSTNNFVSINSPGGIATLSAVDESLFDLNSVDLRTYFSDNGPSPVVFNGFDSSDQMVATNSITLNSPEWVTFSFSNEFRNLKYVTWTQAGKYHVFDNIVINKDTETPATAVPEPATLLLFGAGMVGLAGLRVRGKKK